MRIALIADLHGNRPATLALERDLLITRPDKIYCLGDLVGKGPSNDFTCDWVRAHAQLILGGNWDDGVGKKQFPGDVYYWEQLGKERLSFLRGLPKEADLWLSGRRIRLFHGRPVMEKLITVQDETALIDLFFQAPDGGRYDAVIYADAHRQAMRTMTPGLFVNIGSVGNALGVPKCCYALLEGTPGRQSSPFEIRLRQIDYDREQAVADAKAAPLVPRIDAYIREIQTGLYSRNV